MKRRALLFLFVALLLSATAQPQDAGSRNFQDAFDAYVRGDSIVGAGYVVVESGRIVQTHSVGMADSERNQRVDDNTIFHWGSITKTLTAVSIMRLRDEGRISLDDPIVKYVPELVRIHSDYGPVSQVTLRQLLSHSAGFQGPTWPYRDDTKSWQPFEPTEWAQLVAMMPYQELAFKPGARFSYSNPGFIYLARVIESVTGTPYQEYIRKNLFVPLGMTRSYFNLSPAELARDRSNNYDIRLAADGSDKITANGREFDTGITTPNGGLNAPISDLARWVAFLTGASPVSESILKRSSLEEMWRPVVPVSADTKRPESMGLSFFLDPRPTSTGTVTFVGHTGSQAGFRAFMIFNPQNRRAVIAAFNTSVGDDSTQAARDRAHRSAQSYGDLRERSLALLQ